MAQHIDARLYTVDTFEFYGGLPLFMFRAIRNMKACGVMDRIHVLACRSWDAASLFDDGEVDLLWVDAGHDFTSVKNDLEAWKPKIKPGGILAGHDLKEPGVAKALECFCATTGRTYTVWDKEGWPSWWFQF
jgi:predicted O-methyltransferase YrrM